MATTLTPDGTGFKHDLEGIAHQAGVIKNDVATLAHETAHAVRDGASELKDGAVQAIDAAKARVGQGADFVKEEYDAAKGHAAATAKSVSEYVSAHPLSSIALAAGVGVIAGILFGRSRA